MSSGNYNDQSNDNRQVADDVESGEEEIYKSINQIESLNQPPKSENESDSGSDDSDDSDSDSDSSDNAAV